jgi:hypothetical protein
MTDADKTTSLQEQLAAHRATLTVYLRQLASLGADHAPPGLHNGINDARAGIAHCKTALRAAGVVVDDHSVDTTQAAQENEPTAEAVFNKKQLILPRGLVRRGSFQALTAVIVLLLIIGFVLWLVSREKHVLATYQLSIPAQSGWIPIASNIHRGDKITIAVLDGRWTLGKNQEGWPYVDCNGYIFPSGAPQTYTWAELKSAPVGILIGRIGERGENEFGIGCGASMVADADGPLFLTINDSDTRGDNDGSMEVRITVEH